MHLAMVRSTHQRQVGQGGRTAPGPEQQVMTIAPDRQPVAAGEDTVLIACSERPTGCRRNAPAGVSDLLIEFAQPGDARDGGITGEPLDRRAVPRRLELKLEMRSERRDEHDVDRPATPHLVGDVQITGNGLTTGCATTGPTNCAAVQIVSDTWDIGGAGILNMPYDPSKFYNPLLKGLVK